MPATGKIAALELIRDWAKSWGWTKERYVEVGNRVKEMRSQQDRDDVRQWLLRNAFVLGLTRGRIDKLYEIIDSISL